MISAGKSIEIKQVKLKNRRRNVKIYNGQDARYIVIAINMAKELTKEEVQHVAKLAKISLSDEEAENFRAQLGEILEFVSRLQEVETKNVKPLGQTAGLKNVWREDEIKPSLSQAEALNNAPDQKRGYFKVKPIL